MAGAEKRRSTEPKNTATIDVTATQDSTSDRREQGAQVTLGRELGLLRMGLDVIENALARRELEEERARLETRLQQARPLETIGTLASGIAHNFNNILGAILGYTEIAGERIEAGTQYSDIVQDIRHASEGARQLVDELLMFARRRETRHRPVSLGTLAEESASLLRALLPTTVELVVQ